MARSAGTFRTGHKKVGGSTLEKKAKMKAKSKEKFLIALRGSLGIATTAAKVCAMNIQSHYAYMRDDAKYKKAVEEIGEMTLDYVESKLLELINMGKEASTIFYLKTKGKKRGYIEQPGYEIPPDESEFKMPVIEIVKDIDYEDVTSKRIENE